MNGQFGTIDGMASDHVRIGPWLLDDTDFLLIAMLADPIYGPELMWDDPNNHEYSGCYRVRDYQYPLNRYSSAYKGHQTARSVGKTESIKAKSFTHGFRRTGQGLLLTAPELIHLLPLTDAVEHRIRDCRLTRELLDTRNQKTGFTHRPFGVDFIDGTKIIGRIPKLSGTGVKGMHVPELIIDEAQDYPERGWTEIHEVVMKDTLDADGNPDFHYEFYGVHSGARNTRFYALGQQGGFQIVQVTAIQRPGWNRAEKEAAKAMYGGTSSPDYRRNILGEPGSAASVFFVLARLTACTDQDRESDYNTIGYKHIEMQAEEFDQLGMPMIDLLDLPEGYKEVWGGADIGLTVSPTVISIFAHVRDEKKKLRLQLIRRITMYRFRQRHIVEAWLAIGQRYGAALKGFGIDSTGLGFPIMQAMEDDQAATPHLAAVTRGYKFNAKVPVHVRPENITHGQDGQMRDQYGSQVKEEVDPLTGYRRFVTYMPMIEASTRYLRELVDHLVLMLPFDPDIHRDLMGETAQRIKMLGELAHKPNAFHILDAFRGMAMVYHRDEIEEQIDPEIPAVLDEIPGMVLTPGSVYGGQSLGEYN